VSADSIIVPLASQVWQVTLLATVVWFLCRTVGRNRPHVAHALWALVLLKCVTPPVFTSPLGIFPNHDVVAGFLSNTDPAPKAVLIPDSQLNRALEMQTAESGPVATVSDVVAVSSAIDAQAERKPFHKTIDCLKVLLLGTWAAGSIVVAMRMFRKFSRLSREVASHSVATPEWIDLAVRKQCKVLELRRVPKIVTTDCGLGPATLGLFAPMVLLPRCLLVPSSNRSDREIRAQVEIIIAHELVHCRRGDLFFSLVQAFSVCVWWYHPMVRLASRMLSQEAERACDEETIDALDFSRAAYAGALLSVLQHKQTLGLSVPLPGIRPRDVTRDRLERIMKPRPKSHRRSTVWLTILLAGGLLILTSRPNTSAQEARAPTSPKNGQTSAGSTAATANISARKPSQWKSIDIRRLTASPPDIYSVDKGDVLGVSVPEILPNENKGFPITVLDDGTISLPLLDPIKVDGLSLGQIRTRIIDEYKAARITKKPFDVFVTLIMMRRSNVLVGRFDGGLSSKIKRIDLKGIHSDVLHALQETGGVPKNPIESIVIVRAKDTKHVETQDVLSWIKRDPPQIERLIQRKNGVLHLDQTISPTLDEGDMLLVVPER